MSRASRLRQAACWAVHLYTGTGLLVALAALYAVVRGDARTAFLWLSLAVVIDATDGTLARLARVKEFLPQFDGSKLDDIIDYLTFVLVPLFGMLELGVLAGGTGVTAVAVALLASGYRFCHSDAKTPDHFFTGFPSYWNIVLLYLYVLGAPPELSAALVGVLALLVFAPLRFIYPSRTRLLRGWTLGLGVAWGVIVVWIVLRLPERAVGWATVSLAYPAYYTLLSFYLQWRGVAGGTMLARRDPDR